MRRHRSRHAERAAAPEVAGEGSTTVMDAGGEPLSDLADQAAAVVDALSEASGGSTHPRRRRRRLRWMVLMAAAGGATYAAIRGGVPGKVRSRVGGGNGKPAEGYEPSNPEAASPPSITLTGKPEEEAAAPVAPASDGASDADRGASPG